jgi:hypothetical protein
MHSFSTSASAMHWRDAVLLPGIPVKSNTVALTSTSFAFPMPNDSNVEVATRDFSLEQGAGLFGNREELLRDWSVRLGRELIPQTAPDAAQAPDASVDPRAAF